MTEYITRLFASGNLTEQQSEQTAGLLYVNNSIQRIADRCEDIDQICEKVNNNGKRLTSEASSEMEDCIDIIQQLLKKAMEAIRKGDAVVAETVFKNKKKMHKAEKKYSKAHLNRVKNEVCDASMTRYFSGIMYNFDRMADNCVSIAEEACDNVAFINLDEETGKSMMERGAVENGKEKKHPKICTSADNDNAGNGNNSMWNRGRAIAGSVCYGSCHSCITRRRVRNQSRI